MQTAASVLDNHEDHVIWLLHWPLIYWPPVHVTRYAKYKRLDCFHYHPWILQFAYHGISRRVAEGYSVNTQAGGIFVKEPKADDQMVKNGNTLSGHKWVPKMANVVLFAKNKYI